jgi:predicted ATPase
MVLAPVRIELFGGLKVRVGDQSVDRFQTRRTAALLAYLALEPDVSHPREAVAQAIWPGAPRDPARNRLNQALSSLRRQLEPPGSAHVFVGDHRHIGLVRATVATDLEEFRALVLRAEQGDPNEAMALLERAAAIYRGALLPGIPDDWVEPHRDQAAKLAETVFGRLSVVHQEAGRTATAVAVSGGRTVAAPDAEPSTQATLAAVSIEARHAGLPRLPNRTHGRDDAVRAVLNLLTEGRRWVTLAGIAGIGKSRIAREVAARWGAAHVRWRAVDQTSDLDALLSHDGSEGPLLHVLDCASHLTASQVEGLLLHLDAHRDDRALLTALAPARVDAEVVFPVGPLPIPEPGSSLETVAAAPSVALFVERAQAVKPDFQVTARTYQAVADLCRLLDGMPLAIELAAPGVRSMSPTQLLTALQQGGEIPAARIRGQAERHRSLATALAGSLNLMSPEARLALRLVSVLEPGFDTEAAEAVTDDPGVGQPLSELLEASMLQTLPSQVGPARFAVLAPVRSAMREFLTTEEADAALARANAHFRTLAKRRGPEWLATVEGALSNFKATFERSLAGGEADEALTLATDLAPFFEIKGRLKEGRAWLESALEASPSGPSSLRARIALGRISWHLGDLPVARRLASEAARLAAQADDAETALEADVLLAAEAHTARARLGLGNAAVEVGDWERAAREYQASLAAARDAGNIERQAAALVNIGNLALMQDQTDLADRVLVEAMEAARESGLSRLQAAAHAYMARLRATQGRPQEALVELGLARTAVTEQVASQVEVWEAHGEVALALGDPLAAARFLGFADAVSGRRDAVGIGVEDERRFALLARARAVRPRSAEAFELGRVMTGPEAEAEAEALTERFGATPEQV